MTLPPYVPWAEVHRRLQHIFPTGAPQRQYCTRDVAASTVFALLYVGAVERNGRYAAPKHVYRMSDKQAAVADDPSRLAFAAAALRPGFRPRGRAWYADTTREPIRDETLRQGFEPVGAVVVRIDLPTNSSKPRYALADDFAALFDPGLVAGAFERAVLAWQDDHLTPGALARARLLRQRLAPGHAGILVSFPNGETRRLSAGPSSVISKAVVEDFAPRFLDRPAVIWLSDTDRKLVARDDLVAQSINLRIDVEKDLPDIVMADLGGRTPLLVFVEVVATDSPVTPARREALLALARGAGFDEQHVAFVTAYLSRDAPAFRKTAPQLAWHAFAWFAEEPDAIVALHDGQERPVKLATLLGLS